jgi:glycosyltransferase involved in cell wall biosynthesis
MKEMIATNKRNSRVAFFFPFPMLDSVPSLRNAITLLARKGYAIDIFTVRQQTWTEPEFEEKNITIYTKHTGFFREGGIIFPKWICSIISRIYRLFIIQIFRPLLRFLYLRRIFSQRNKSMPYSCIIGVDPEGLIDGAYWAQLFRIPLVYYSLELLFSNEIKTRGGRKLKKLEIELSRQAIFTIIQDEERAKALVEENQISPDNVVLVPNAPLGLARACKNRYLHEKYSIGSEQKILLSAGYISEWTASRDLVRVAATWPDEYVLVMHSRVQAGNDPWVQSLIKEAKSSKVKFSLDPLPFDEYIKMINSADIGLVFYKMLPSSRYTQKNLELVGLSSGKFATYLQNGLPVIVSGADGLRRLVESYKCGIYASEAFEIIEAVKDIMGRYDFYSINAQRCFNEQLEFGRYFVKAIERIDRA